MWELAIVTVLAEKRERINIQGKVFYFMFCLKWKEAKAKNRQPDWVSGG